MIEGRLRHGTDAEIEANYTDTHGATIMWTSQGDRRYLACPFPMKIAVSASAARWPRIRCPRRSCGLRRPGRTDYHPRVRWRVCSSRLGG